MNRSQEARGKGGPRKKDGPVLRTLVTLLVGAAFCLVIVALGETGVLHYPEGPGSTQVEDSSGAPESSEGASATDAATDDDQSSSDSGTSEGEPTSPNQRLAYMLKNHQVKSIRLIGDSITAGVGCDGYGAESDTGVTVYSGSRGTYTESATTIRCWANDFRTYSADYGVTSFVNAGVDGFRMQYLAEDPSAWLGDGADVIVVMLGTNDAARRSLEDFSADAEIGLAAAAAKCDLLVVVTPPVNDRTDATNLYSVSEINDVLTEICQMKGYAHVDFEDVLTLGTDDFNDDALHPTTSGSDKLWEAFREQLELP